MYRELIRLVERFGRPRIGVVGDLMLDRYVFGDAERVSPEAPVQILRAAHEETRIGGAGSVVNNLLTLGARVTAFGILGADDAGDEIIGRLRSSGAATAGVLRVAGRPTTIKTRFIGRAQHRHPQQVLRVDWEDDQPLDAQVEDRLLAKISKFVAKADVIVASDYNKGVLSPRVMHEIVRLARRRHVPVLVDPIKGRDYSKYAGATLLTPNRLETELASGIRLAGPDSIRRATKRLMGDLKLDALVITLDKEGAYLATRGKPGQKVPTRARPVYDVTGAGDMVIAVLAMAVASGATLLDAVRLANVAGGLEVQKFGVQTVSREEIVSELLDEARHHGDKTRSLNNLMADLSRCRARGQRIVWTNGCFDLLHAGHIDFLEFAGRQGDVLVVGLNSDKSVRAIKGPGRPICSQEHRTRVLAALEVVDYLVLYDDPTPRRLVEAVRPNVLVKGEDWRQKGVVGRRVVESYGGRVVLAPLTRGLSTTALLQRIRRSKPAAASPTKKGRSK